jgi:hypothetical protein
MVTNIFNVDSVKGSGKITFDLATDATGAHETVSASIGGEKFSLHVDCGPGTHTGFSITHTQNGLFTLSVVAESSNVSSGDYVLDL